MTRTDNRSLELERAFIAGLFFELLDSIRYAKDQQPRYKKLEHKVKIRTTDQIKRIADSAAQFFMKEGTSSELISPAKSQDLVARALEHALEKSDNT